MQSDTASQSLATNDRHAKLTRIAVFANLFAWIVLVFFVLSAGAKWISTRNQYDVLNASAGQSGQYFTFDQKIQRDPVYAITIGLNVASIVMQGIVAALVLKGISLSLFMIVETDLNYRAVKEKDGVQ